MYLNLGTRKHFHFYKIHWLSHYIDCILSRGSPDNFNTQFTERLHSLLIKAIYRHTNKRNEEKQMPTMVDRHEKLRSKQSFISHALRSDDSYLSKAWIEANPTILNLYTQIPLQRPTIRNLSLPACALQYYAPLLKRSLQKYLASLFRVASASLAHYAYEDFWDIACIDVYHQLKFRYIDKAQDETADILYSYPSQSGNPSRFDVGVIYTKGEGIKNKLLYCSLFYFKSFFTYHLLSIGLRAARVRIMFSIPEHWLSDKRVPIDIQKKIPKRLAYVEWFSRFQSSDSHSGFYQISKELDLSGNLRSDIIPLHSLIAAAHLIPKYPSINTIDRKALSSHNILDNCSHFYLNTYRNQNSFLLFRQ